MTELNRSQAKKVSIWYDSPADDWLKALPLGNGRLAAMVFGTVEREQVQLNEESLWSGCPVEDDNPEMLKNLDKVRKLLLEGKNSEAIKLNVVSALGKPSNLRSYQTLGEMIIEFEGQNGASNYRRELNMSEGIVTASYTVDGVNFMRECFISAVDDEAVYRITSDKPGKITANITMIRNQDAKTKTINERTIESSGQIFDDENPAFGPGGPHMRFATGITVKNEGGSVSSKNGKIIVQAADTLTIYINAATDYNIEKMNFDISKDPSALVHINLDRVIRKSYHEVREAHINDHRELFERVSLELNAVDKDIIPTDKRLEALKEGENDPGLIATYFQYGRYLLMGSSRRPGVLPANLQGKWNKEYNAPWGSDYHTNINLQMNYWPSDVTNLKETVEPLGIFLKSLSIPGERTAKKSYGARGWTVHHNTDIFGRTAVHDSGDVGFFPLGGPWMSLSLWEHYEFTRDRRYLEESIYPLLKGSARFLLDFLIEARNGYLVTAPSNSPENSFYYTDEKGNKVHMLLTYASTMDMEIVRAVFERTAEASRILGKDNEFAVEIEKALNRLPPLKISERYGIIQEWIEDYEETEPGHRHISQLYGVYPGDSINSANPDLFEAAKRTITRRLEYGGAATGWSRAWTINFFARFKDGEKALENVMALLQLSTAGNLFDMHPPFQIDGNFGGTAGIAEMLVQSHEGGFGNRIINILPALPGEWTRGKITGLVARGNFVVDIQWNENKAEKVVITSNAGGICSVAYKGIENWIITASGKEVAILESLENLIKFDTITGEKYLLSNDT
jgi:alpha-L-fucosidase 2